MREPAVEWLHSTYCIRLGFWRRKKVILHDLCLRVAQGMTLGLIGPNGAGKTTVIMLGAGLLKPDLGRVQVAGRDAFDVASKRGIGCLTERPYFYPRLTLLEWMHMLVGLSGIGRTEGRRAVEKQLDLLGLRDQGPLQMGTLSKGQLQRAGLAQALVHRPSLLFLDEPMSGLDPCWRSRLLEIMLELKRAGRTIVFSSHILSDVETICDEVVLMDQGKLRWTGDMSAIEKTFRMFDIRMEATRQEFLSELRGKGVLVIHKCRNTYHLRVQGPLLDKILALAATRKIRLESLNPVYADFDELLTRFGRENAGNSGWRV